MLHLIGCRLFSEVALIPSVTSRFLCNLLTLFPTHHLIFTACQCFLKETMGGWGHPCWCCYSNAPSDPRNLEIQVNGSILLVIQDWNRMCAHSFIPKLPWCSESDGSSRERSMFHYQKTRDLWPKEQGLFYNCNPPLKLCIFIVSSPYKYSLIQSFFLPIEPLKPSFQR